jgi:hypothetical protein
MQRDAATLLDIVQAAQLIIEFMQVSIGRLSSAI